MRRQVGNVFALAALIAAGCGGTAAPKPSGETAGTQGSAGGGAAGAASGGRAGIAGVPGGASGGNGGAAGMVGASGGMGGAGLASGGRAGIAGGPGGASGGGNGGSAGMAGASGGMGGAAKSGLGGGGAMGGEGGHGGGGDCPPNEVWAGSFCSPPPPKLVAPLPGSAVGTSEPDLFFEFAKGFTSVKLDVCADRACSHIFRSIVAGGNVSGVATIGLGQSLPNGMTFWRGSTSGSGSTADVLISPVWEFAVLAHDKTWHQPFTWPQFADVEGDGFADLVVLSSSGGVVMVDEYAGSPSGLPQTPTSSSGPLSGSSCADPSLAGVGDVDGDGLGDVVIGDCDSLDVLAGGLSGFALPFSYRTPVAGTFVSLVVSGDINGDGYADVTGIAKTGPNAPPQLWQFFGGPQGLVASPNGPISLPVGADDNCNVQVLGDINADGHADVVVADRSFGGGTGIVWIFKGGAAGLSAMPSTVSPPPGVYNFGSFPPSVGGTMTSDVGGDGILVLLVGGTTDAAGSRGQVYAYALAGGVQMVGTPLSLFPGGASGVSSITGVDVNGDGFGDVVVGVGSQIAVFRGSIGGLPSSPSDVLVAPNVPGAGGGEVVRGVAALGDVNGDGRADFAAEIDVPGASPSVVPVVYEGSDGPLPQTPALTLSGSQAISLW